MELKQIVNSALLDQMSFDDVESWVQRNQSRYRRPPLMEALRKAGKHDDNTGRLIDDYADWEVRINELGQLLTDLTKRVLVLKQGDHQVLRTARLIYTLSKLYETSLAQANGAFTLGYTLWQYRNYYDAIELLAEAAELFRRSSGKSLMEVTALSYCSDCLRQDKQFDEAIKWATLLRERARLYGFRGHEALALRDLGMAHCELGRERESLTHLREAAQIRRAITDQEVREQSVIPLAAFLDALGGAARKFGYFDEAARSFVEMAEIQRCEGDYHGEARALSEIGYTYQQSGELSRAIEYLRNAIRLEEKEGSTADSKRWKLQVAMMQDGTIQSYDGASCRTTTEAKTEEVGGIPDLEIEDAPAALLLAEQANELATQGKYESALQIASAVLRWAVAQRDTHCQVVCRNVMGICHDNLGHTPEAIREFQEGIKVADPGGSSASLLLRYNLAKTFLKLGNFQNSADVLESGIAMSQLLLTRVESFAFRQNVLSEAISLYELYALLLAQVDAKPNHRALLAITDVARAREMGTWARALAQCMGKTMPKDIAIQIEERLRELRAAEVELDFRHLNSNLTYSKAGDLQRQIDRLQIDIENSAATAGTAVRFSRPRPGWDPFGEMEHALSTVLIPGTAILSLFSIPEGICPTVFYLGENEREIQSGGSIVTWERDERLRVLSQWTNETGVLRSRAMAMRAIGELGITATTARDEGSSAQFLDAFLRCAEGRLFGELISLLRRFRPRRVAIIPHRELALIPYWRLADGCESIEGLALIPSLKLLEICVNRSRSLRGKTILIPDVTATLPKARAEISMVKSVRNNSGTVSAVDQLIERGQEINLLHVSAHGVFNSRKPYCSGFLMGSGGDAGLFTQYARLMRVNGDTVCHFSGAPTDGSYRLLTVAECMAKLSLRECRLAVLSTCECGLADTQGGGELIGLPTSLLVAGAKSVIAALWPVDDAATALLMHRFYSHWEGGAGGHTSPARSLSLARRDLQQMGRKEIIELLGPDTVLPEGERPFGHPVYSDAFQCYGDW